MLNDNSSAISAASRRLEVSPGNTANTNAAGNMNPAGGAIPASDSGEARQGYLPVRVEQSSNAEGSATSFERYVRPPYVPVFVSSADGLLAEAEMDASEEMMEEIGAEAALASNEQTVQSVSDMVKMLYDLPE